LLKRAAAEQERSKFIDIHHANRELIGGLWPSNVDSDYFEIFSGSPDTGGVWLGTVIGIDRARGRVRELAADKPGEYFALHCRTNAVVRFA